MILKCKKGLFLTCGIGGMGVKLYAEGITHMATLSYLLTQHPDLFNNHFTGGTLFCGSKCRGAIIQRQIWNHMTGQIAIVTASKALSFGADEIITIEKLPRALELIVSGKAGKRLWLRLLLPQSTTTRKEEFALTA